MKVKHPGGVVLSITFATVLFVGCGGDGSEEPFSASATQPAWCDVADSPCCNNCAVSPALVVSITNASSSVGGDGTLTLEISGDLDAGDEEALTVSVEGLALGTIFNGNPADDQFDHPTDSIDDCTLTTIAANLPAASLTGIVADGRIDVTLTPDQGNNDIEDEGCDGADDETLTVTVEYPV